MIGPGPGREILALLMIALVVTLSTGCGQEAAGGVAVRAGETSITRSTVEHWISVVAGEGTTAPVPDPPNYTTCVAQLRGSQLRQAGGQQSPSTLDLKRDCRARYEKYKLKALYFLISFDWVEAEAAELGIKLDDSTVKRQLALIQSPSARRFLIGTRGTIGDELKRVRLSLLESQVQHKLETQLGTKGLSVAQRQLALIRFGMRFVKMWTARTSCGAGYVVPLCRGRTTPAVAPTLTPPRVPLTNLTAR
jgi:hypothetical protein